MELIEIITGGATVVMGLFFIALSFFGWGDISLFLEPEEERSMRVILLLVALIGAIFLISGLDTFINFTG